MPRVRKPPNASERPRAGLSNFVLVALVAGVVAAALQYYSNAQEQPTRADASPTTAAARRKATDLHFAAQHGNVEAARQLLKSGAAVDVQTKLGATALHVAAEQGQLDIAELLIDHGASLEMATDAGLTALHFAAEQGRTALAIELLKRGAAVDAQTSSGHTPLHISAQKGAIETMKVMLSRGASIDARTSKGHSVLHLATLTSQLDALRLLLRQGAPVDAVTTSGHTPLHLAASKGQATAARVLIAAGASIHARTGMLHTPLHLAADASDVTADGGSEEVTRLLIGSGSELEAVDNRGRTPVHTAADSGARDALAVLLGAGALATTASTSGLTPLDVAIYHPQAATFTDGSSLESLLDAGASVHSAHPWSGQTAMHAAAFLGRWSQAYLVRSHHARHPATRLPSRRPSATSCPSAASLTSHAPRRLARPCRLPCSTCSNSCGHAGSNSRRVVRSPPGASWTPPQLHPPSHVTLAGPLLALASCGASNRLVEHASFGQELHRNVTLIDTRCHPLRLHPAATPWRRARRQLPPTARRWTGAAGT